MTKTTLKRLASLVIVAALALTLVSCGGYKYGSSVDKTVVAKVGKFEVTADEYNYFYLNAKFELDRGFESYWTNNPDADELLKSRVEAMLKNRYAVDTLAAECAVSLDKDDLESINEEAEAAAEYYGGSEGFAEALAESNMTGDLYYELTKQALLDEKLRYYYIAEFSGYVLADDKTLLGDLDKNFARMKQVFIENEVNDDILANKALAEDIAKRARSGEDFDALIKQYGEDDAQHIEDGRYLTHGMMLEPIEEAVYALDEGEISGVVESTLGYHVIKRLPMESDYIDLHFEELRELYKNRVYNEKLAEVAASLSFEYVTED